MSDDQIQLRRARLSTERQLLLERRLRGRAAPDSIPRRSDGEPIPLSLFQQRLWFLEQLQPGNPAYLISCARRLSLPICAELLERAIHAVVARHEALRTTIPIVDGQPCQRVTPSLDVPFRLVDLRGVAEEHREHQAERLAADEATRPFDLQTGPLLRCVLVTLDASDHVLVVTMHHIVSDAWSVNVLWNEIDACYAALSRGAAPALPPLAAQYPDFSVWQRQWLSGPRLERQIAYWATQLAGLSTLALPTDRPRPPLATTEGRSRWLDLPRELTARLSELALHENATLFMALMAGFQVVLARFTGQEDIAVGTAVTGRGRPELEPLIGFFVNSLVIRGDLSGEPTFRELLRRIRETVLEAFAHQDVPFELLVERLQPPRDLSRNPLFQVLFQLKKVPTAVASRDMAAAPLPGGAMFDLVFDLVETPDGVHGQISYAAALFDEATIARLAQCYRRILEAAAEPDTPIWDMPLMTEDEARNLVARWSPAQLPARNAGVPVQSRFEHQAIRTPDAIAVEDDQRAWSYAELRARAHGIAARLRQMGVERGSIVGIGVRRGAELVAAVLGVLAAGAAYLPLDPSYPAQRLALMLGDAGARTVIADEEWPAELAGTATLLDVTGADLAFDAGGPDGPCAATDLAYLIYTSGSTGAPKGVLVEHGSAGRLIAEIEEVLQVTARDRWLAVSSLSFDVSFLELMLPLSVGATVVVASREAATDGAKLAALIRSSRATIMQATPSTWRMLVEAGWQGSTGLTILSGGEPLSTDLTQALAEHGGVLWNLYGPTETTIWVTCHRVEPSDARIPIGQPLPSARFYVLDRKMRPVPEAVIGELYVGGPCVARGYHGRPALTDERFLPDPFAPGGRMYRTGDLCRFHAGRFELLGRTDDQLKLRGFRIEAGEVETAMRSHPAIRDAVVVVRSFGPADQRLVGYAVAVADVTADLRAHLRSRLPEYMVPSLLVMLPHLPVTPNGKIDRRALPDPGPAAPTRVAVPPRDELERTTAALWRDVLRVADVGVFDNFFELGGHSLLATQLVSRIRNALGIELPVRSVFEAPTVAQLASAIAMLRWTLDQRHSGPITDAAVGEVGEI